MAMLFGLKKIPISFNILPPMKQDLRFENYPYQQTLSPMINPHQLSMDSGELTAISKSPGLSHLVYWLVRPPNMRLTTAFLYVQQFV
jgi:hypothetical protein